MWMDLRVVWQFEFDRSAGEHDEREGGFGAVESVGAIDHGADLVVESLVASVGQLSVDGGGDAVLMAADRATSPASLVGSSFSAATRPHIAPTVRQATRANAATVDLSDRVTSHTTRSSKSRVNRAPARANGTSSVITPCSGQASRRRRIRSRHSCPPRSRCLQEESTSRRSYRRRVLNEHDGHTSALRRSATSTTTEPSPSASSSRTPVTLTPERSRTRLSKVVARTGDSKGRCCRKLPNLRDTRAPHQTSAHDKPPIPHLSRPTDTSIEPQILPG